MAWWNRKPPGMQGGSVLFRGRWVARPDDFAFLRQRGIELGPAARLEGWGWRAPLRHAQWGAGALYILPDPTLPPEVLVRLDPRLTDSERAEIRGCQYAVAVASEPRTGNVLSDRKDLLRFLHAVMGAEGVAAIDHAAQAFWSRRALEYELGQDADLDIDAIYTIHLVGPGEEGAREHEWLHTHGLREMGFCDFDVIDPSEDLARSGHDLIRALAFAVVEEELVPGGDPVRVARGIDVRAVAASEFLARAAPGDHPRYRALVDHEHLEGHAVVCEPAARRALWQRLLRPAAPRPCAALARSLPDEGVVFFSHSASDLMSRRARGSLALFRSAMEEVAELEPLPLVKIGYVVDGGGPQDVEHLWFRVHGFQGDQVDGTLVNAPYGIERLKENDRGLHPLEQLSDWLILTPAGQIDPRQTYVLRNIRENWDRMRALVKEAKEQGQGRGS